MSLRAELNPELGRVESYLCTVFHDAIGMRPDLPYRLVADSALPLVKQKKRINLPFELCHLRDELNQKLVADDDWRKFVREEHPVFTCTSRIPGPLEVYYSTMYLTSSMAYYQVNLDDREDNTVSIKDVANAVERAWQSRLLGDDKDLPWEEVARCVLNEIKEVSDDQCLIQVSDTEIFLEICSRSHENMKAKRIWGEGLQREWEIYSKSFLELCGPHCQHVRDDVILIVTAVLNKLSMHVSDKVIFSEAN